MTAFKLSAGIIREKQLRKQICEHIGGVKTLANSRLQGLKPDRDEVLARLSNLDDLQSSYLALTVFH